MKMNNDKVDMINKFNLFSKIVFKCCEVCCCKRFYGIKRFQLGSKINSTRQMLLYVTTFWVVDKKIEQIMSINYIGVWSN